MDRLPHCLAHEIPQRHIDCPDGPHAGRSLALPDFLIDVLAPERILADQHGLR